MAKKYRLPTSKTAAMAAAPARLAQECGGSALWRGRPDGRIEVATIRDGRLERHLVHEDGTTTLVDAAPPPRGHSWATPLAYLGFGICVLTLLGTMLGGIAVGTCFRLVIAGMAVMGVGVVAEAYKSDVEKRVKRRGDAAGEWHEPAKLSGWSPQTVAQLVAVEQLADEHDGVAYLRDVGGQTVDVVVSRRGGLARYSVDQSGRTELTDSSRWSSSELAVQAARFLSVPLFFATFVAVTSVHGSARGAVIFGLAAACAACVGISILFRSSGSLPSQDGPFAWLEIRTVEEERRD